MARERSKRASAPVSPEEALRNIKALPNGRTSLKNLVRFLGLSNSPSVEKALKTWGVQSGSRILADKTATALETLEQRDHRRATLRLLYDTGFEPRVNPVKYFSVVFAADKIVAAAGPG